MRILVYSEFVIQPILFYIIEEHLRNYNNNNNMINNFTKFYYLSCIGLNLFAYLVSFRMHTNQNYMLFTIMILINYYVPLVIYWEIV